MNKKLKLLMLSLGVVSLFLMSSLSAPVVATPLSAERASELPPEIKLCGVFPISQRPDAGPDRRDGFLIAVDEINGQTGTDRILPEGVTLVPLVKDDDNSAEGGTAAANSCISDGADLVIGSSGSTVSAAMAAVLTPNKIIQISYASSSPSLSNRTVYPYFMRNVASDADQGLAVADLVASLGFTSGAIINTDDSYGTGLVTHFKARWSGNIVAEQTFTPKATDVGSEVQAIADASPEFVLLHAIDNDAKTVFKKAFELGIAGADSDIVWIITDGSSTTATFAGDTEVKDAMQFAIGTNPGEAGATTYDHFWELWNTTDTCGTQSPCAFARTGAVPNSYARFAYDAVFIAAKGIAAAGQVDDSDALLAELYKVEFVGAGGQIKFNELGEVNGRFDYVQLIGDTYNTFGTWAGTPSFDGTEITLANSQVKEFVEIVAGGTTTSPGFELLIGILGLGILVIARRRKEN
jgi:branched-chain amino acid transport system substrate-binding protein